MKFLIVDDDPEIVDSLQMILGEQPTAVARSRDAALATLREEHSPEDPYTAIVLDMMLPSINGKRILQWVRTFEKHQKFSNDQQAKIVVTTGMGDLLEQVVGPLGELHDAYLDKPSRTIHTP